MISCLLMRVLIFVSISCAFACDQQIPAEKIPTLFKLCVHQIYSAKDDTQYPLEYIGVGVATADKRLCNKVLRRILGQDGLSADISMVEQLMQECGGLRPALTLQGLVRNADTKDQHHECPIDVINPGFNMNGQHRNFMNMLQKYGLSFNADNGQRLVSRAIKNNNQDFVRYAVANGLDVSKYLCLTLAYHDMDTFNRMCKQLCFKGCKNNCYKVHQSDNPLYHSIAKAVSPVTGSVFFQAYGFRHAPKQQRLLAIMKSSLPATHELFAAGLAKNYSIAIYKPYALEHDWIIKTDIDKEMPVRVFEYKVGDEISYTFVWNEHTLTLPYQSSGIAASLLRQKKDIDKLNAVQKRAALALKPSQFNAFTREDMGLEIFYHA